MIRRLAANPLCKILQISLDQAIRVGLVSNDMEEENKSTKPPLITIMGLGLALAAPVLYTLFAEAFLFSDQSHTLLHIYMGLFVMWFLAVAVVLLTLWAEKRPLSSIGWKRPPQRLILLAVGLGVMFSIAVPALTILAGMIFPADESGSIESVAQIPWLLMLVSIVTAGITEEILCRGYAMERLLDWTGSKWISSIISLVFFTVLHISGWNMAHIVGVVIPLGAAMIALYWWKRNLILVIIVHIVINLPLVFLAFSGGEG